MVDLQTLRSYFSTLTWYFGGNLSRDMLSILDFLEHETDAAHLTGSWRRAYATAHYWQAQVRRQLRVAELDITLDALRREADCRKRIMQQQGTIRTANVRAALWEIPEHRQLLDWRSTYDEILSIVDGVIASLDPQIVVQESVAARRQEEFDNQQ